MLLILVRLILKLEQKKKRLSGVSVKKSLGLLGIKKNDPVVVCW
jgi:hypothetical protein